MFDLSTILGVVLMPLLGQLKPLIVGALVAIFVQFAKQVDTVVLPADNAKRIKGVAASLSVIAGVLVAFADGNLTSFDWSGVANALADLLIVGVSSAGTWAIALKGKNLLGK